jgi:predicted transcriptional regulator
MDIWVITFSIIVIAFIAGGIIFYNFKKNGQKDSNNSLFNLRFQIKEMNLEKANVFATRKNIVLGKEDSLLDAIELFLAHRLNVLPVVEGEKVIGVLTKKILIKTIYEKEIKKLGETKVLSLMEKNFISCESNVELK